MEYKLQSGRWILAEDAQNMICPCIYDVILDYSGGLATVCLDGRWMTVDKQGRIGKFAIVAAERKEKGPLFRIVDEQGRGDVLRYEDFIDALDVLLERCGAQEDNDEEACLREGFEGTQSGGECCTIDHEKNLLIPGIHGCSFPISEEYLAALEKSCAYSAKAGENKWGLVDAKSHMPILPFEYEDLNMVDRHLVKVKKNGKWGIVDARISAYRSCGEM